MNGDIEEAIRKAATDKVSQDEALTSIFMRCFGLPTEQPPQEKVAEAGFYAYGMLAVDVAVRLANLFLSIKRNTGTHQVACDLTYQLATNEFWAKNASVLMPVVHICLNAHTDGTLLLTERALRNEYSSHDALISCARAVPLEIFPLVAYLLGGPTLQREASIPLKQALAPYFLTN